MEGRDGHGNRGRFLIPPLKGEGGERSSPGRGYVGEELRVHPTDSHRAKRDASRPSPRSGEG